MKVNVRITKVSHEEVDVNPVDILNNIKQSALNGYYLNNGNLCYEDFGGGHSWTEVAGKATDTQIKVNEACNTLLQYLRESK